MNKHFEILLLIIAILISCNSQTSCVKLKHSAKDSIVRHYIKLADSFPYFDTTDNHYKMLKAYFGNDTHYLKNSIDDLGYSIALTPKEFIHDSCAKPALLLNRGVDEVYRFVYEGAFNTIKTNITVLNSKSGAELHFLTYKPKVSEEPCKKIDEYHKRLTSKQWEEIKLLIQYADFWGLRCENGQKGVDGASLYVDGYLRGSNKTEDKWQRVYRWNPKRNAIWDVYELIYEVSGFGLNATK